MVKQAKDKNDVDELFKIYFSCIKGRYFSEALKAFEIYDGYGHECVCCSLASTYQSWEEGYFGETGVKISIDYPAVSTDTIAIVTNEEFYKYIAEESKKYPDLSMEINKALEGIRKRLNL